MLRDWIFNTALLLGLSDVCEYIEYLDDVRQQEEIKKADPDVLVDPIEEVAKPREFDLMVHFSNIVLKSIAECGLDFVKSEEIYSNENCEIDLTKLSKQIHAIRCISGWDGLGCTKSNQKVDGVDLKRYIKRYLLLNGRLVGFIVFNSGTIGFIGLLIPHFVRLIFGSNHKKLLPVAVAFGGLVTVVMDILSRTLINGIDIPLGVVFSLIGAPCFIYMMLKQNYRFGAK